MKTKATLNDFTIQEIMNHLIERSDSYVVRYEMNSVVIRGKYRTD